MNLKFKEYKLNSIQAPNLLMNPVELKDYIDFEVKRVYYVTNVTGETGAHCHKIEKEFFILIIVANIIAWPSAYLAIGKLLDSYAFKTEITIWIFIPAGLLTMLLTLFTISVQIMKAARTKPVEALKYK